MAKVKRTNRELEIIQECRVLVRNNPTLKKRKLSKIKDVDKRLYYMKVWIITESNPIHKLKNAKKRGFSRNKYHLDHIFPISVGYHENIPPEVIGDIRNLQFIKGWKNIEKGNTVTYKAKLLIQEIKRFKRKG